MLLADQGVAQLLGPVEMDVHLRQIRRQGDHRPYVHLPGIICHGLDRGIALERGVGLQTTRRFDDLQRIGRGHQDLREQGIVTAGLQRQLRKMPTSPGMPPG